MSLADAEHFVRAPEWTWYILGYFFLAGLSGGSYFLAALMRLNGNPADEPAARLGFYVAFPTFLACPVLLTLDLGEPMRFWHMLVNTTPGELGPVFKYWSPMSVGAWALVGFGAFVTVSFVDTFLRDRGRGLPLMGGALGKLWVLLGAVVALFIAGYTGVLLAVSNQPVWSDTWALGGLFLASGLTGSAALLGWLAHHRRDARASTGALVRLERIFPLIELALIVLFVVLLVPPGALSRAFEYPWFLLWAVALLGLLPGLGGFFTGGLRVSPGGTAAAARGIFWVTILVLAGTLALRAAVIFSAQ